MSDVDVVVVNQNVPYLSVTGTNLPAMAGPTGARGNTGATGPRGFELLNGDGLPPSTLGKNGDFYIDNTSFKIHGPKAAGTWPAGRDLRGPTGPTGPIGPRGLTGPQGAQGTAGDPASIPFAGTGGQNSVARSDHNHDQVLVMNASVPMITGTAPTGQTRMQFGTFVGTCSNNGSMNVPFPIPFPGGLTTVIANAGDNSPRWISGNADNLTSLLVKTEFTTLSSFRIVAYDASKASGYLPAGHLIRVNYVAFGW